MCCTSRALHLTRAGGTAPHNPVTLPPLGSQVGRNPRIVLMRPWRRGQGWELGAPALGRPLWNPTICCSLPRSFSSVLMFSLVN